MRVTLSFLAVRAASGLREPLGTLDVWSAVPEAQTKTCLQTCGLPQVACTARNFSAVVHLALARHVGYDDHMQHQLGAWAATVWRPPALMQELYRIWQEMPWPRVASFIHGVVWHIMYDFQPSGEPVDAEGLMDYVMDVIGLDLTKTPPETEVIMHGVGHGVLHAVNKAAGLGDDELSCLTLQLNVSSELLLAAEEICLSAPGNVLRFVCMSGIYHTLQHTPNPRVPTSIAQIANASLLDPCDNVEYPALCVYWMLNRAHEADEDGAYTRAVDTVIEGGLRQDEKDPRRPRRSFIERLCPVERWPSPRKRRGCFFGFSASLIIKVGSVRHGGSEDMAFEFGYERGSFRWCRPSQATFDEETVLRTAACVSGSMWPATVGLSDHFYWWFNKHYTIPAVGCHEECGRLATDDNINMRAAAPYCQHLKLCDDLRDWSLTGGPTHRILANVDMLMDDAHNLLPKS